MSGSSSTRMRQLARAKLDQIGKRWRQFLAQPVGIPRGGWIAATRDALSMSQTDLARRLGVMPSSIVKLEARERAGTIQLDTLRRVADALDCDLVVVMVPRQSLQAMVDQQRIKQYAATLGRVTAHMNLENQPVSEELHQHLLEQAKAAIPDSALWRDSGLE